MKARGWCQGLSTTTRTYSFQTGSFKEPELLHKLASKVPGSVYTSPFWGIGHLCPPLYVDTSNLNSDPQTCIASVFAP